MTDLLIGTGNKYKAALYRDMLGDTVDIVTPADLSLDLDIEEDAFDIVGNSWKKARAYAKAAGMLALSDDTGIFIPALNNEPGVAARRWAGELPNDVSDEEWINHFLMKISPLHDDQLAVVKSQVVTVAKPSGHIRWSEFATEGTLLRKPSPAGYTPGGPFGAYFKIDSFGKAESELTQDDKAAHNLKLRAHILQAVTELTKPRVPATLRDGADTYL